ncbi:PrsW family intramembrane metalloprotease [Patescibacteria group bacterium]|nr:PrsW family intramembrane metalloprotease [Patescibacteria group bacterium]
MNTALSVSKTVVVVLCTGLAFIPILLWGGHFLSKYKASRKWIIITFIGGALAVTPLLIYKYLWQFFPWINAFVWTRSLNVDILGLSSFMMVPWAVVATFIFVGIIEEISKMFSVKLIDKHILTNVDDAIVFSIVAALGFAFVENAIYFYNIVFLRGFENLLFPFVFRSLFSTFAHVMFSGIFGYFYGVAHFANPVLKRAIRKNRHPILVFFHKHFHWKRSVMFHDEKILEGLFFASGLHAFFNIILEMEWTFMIIPFLVMGYAILDHLIKEKDNLKKYGKVIPVRTSS